MIWIVFGVLFLVLLVLFLFAILYEYCFSKKLEIQSILKKYLVHVLVVIFLFALITPLILYFFGLFKEKRALENSDILGYYGALIGGGVTVLGIYWTFNYERLISAEERKAALILSRTVKLGREMLEAGETDADKIVEAMKKNIETEPLAKIDYVKAVDGLTMQQVKKVQKPMLVAMAVYIGKTRLIDNTIWD